LPGPVVGKFLAYEIVIHTPGEHFVAKKNFDMEV
jgi:carbonic anhydrase